MKLRDKVYYVYISLKYAYEIYLPLLNNIHAFRELEYKNASKFWQSDVIDLINIFFVVCCLLCVLGPYSAVLRILGAAFRNYSW